MLTPDQLTEFETKGYLVVEDVLDPEVLAHVKAEYADLLNTLYSRWHAEGRVPDGAGLDFWGKLLAAYKAGCDWFQPMDITLPGSQIYADTPFHIGPAVFDMITNPRLLDMVQSLIGPEITSNPIQHIRIKMPSDIVTTGENRPHLMTTDWHQDRAVALAEADSTNMVTVWLAVSDATEENGCLQVIPGKPEMLTHCPKRQTSIADGLIDTTAAVPLPVKAGGAVLFHPLTPHSSLPNRTDGYRWSFDLRYNVTGQDTGRRHFPDFVARSQANPDRELRDWREWSAMWHDARARLAVAPHTPIHRWQGDSPVCA